MYSNLRAAYFTEGQFVRATLSSLRHGKAIDPGLMFNAFEKVAFDFFLGLDKYRKTLKEAGAPGVYLAGSGPCLFTFFSGKEKARELFSRLRKQGLECYLVSSFPHTKVAAGLKTRRAR
jgi:4-diphosphocytidyl-2-C-methyl-D-erythritol kinase